MFGGGIKFSSANGLLIKAEYTETEFQTVDLAAAGGNGNTISAQPEQKAGRIAIGYQF